MKIINHQINLQTKAEYDMIDITHHLAKWVADNNLQNGIINTFLEHTSAALCINEFTDQRLLHDIKRRLEELNPKDRHYEHNESHACNNDGCINGHSHCNAIFLPTSITVQIIGGKINLGIWQRLFLIELDRSRPRTVSLMFVGE
ncbi:MAG: secondary thiamine-phosphate synthase enzyme YjbQ [Patescibacteria group bacterium]